MRLDEAMSRAMGCREGDTVQACARLMREENVGFVPICDQAGKPIGAVTDRDLAIRVLAEGRPADTPVSRVMTKSVVCCRLEDDITAAERLMQERRLSRVMVCDEQGKLQGVVSLADLSELESEGELGHTLQQVKRDEGERPPAH